MTGSGVRRPPHLTGGGGSAWERDLREGGRAATGPFGRGCPPSSSDAVARRLGGVDPYGVNCSISQRLTQLRRRIPQQLLREPR